MKKAYLNINPSLNHDANIFSHLFKKIKTSINTSINYLINSFQSSSPGKNKIYSDSERIKSKKAKEANITPFNLYINNIMK